jgi:hypothetical protein
MGIYKAIQLVADLAKRGVIKDYAVTGAVAALAYIEPTLTEDLDILVSVADFEQQSSGLILVSPIERSLAEMGYTRRSGAGIMVEGWPVEFLPTASELDEESLREAVETDIAEGAAARVLKAEHLVAKAVSVGRLKDLARVEAFLDQDAVDLAALKSVIERFDLREAWTSFCSRAGRPDPLGLG